MNASEPKRRKARKTPGAPAVVWTGQRGTEAGFTLIELMVSMAVMSMILAAAYVCFSSGVSTQRLVESRTDVIQNARVAMGILSADLRSACPLSKEIDFLGMHRMLGTVEADNLDFGTHQYSPRHAGEGDFCEVSYFLTAEPGTGRLSLWRRRNPMISPNPLSGGGREEIASGVRGLRFEYYDGLDWYDEWGDVEGHGKADNSLKLRPNLTGMPEAVRITLWFDPDAEPSSSDSPPQSGEEPPPMMFQTVARLNLAPMALEAETDAGSNTIGTPGEGSARAASEGGRPE